MLRGTNSQLFYHAIELETRVNRRQEGDFLEIRKLREAAGLSVVEVAQALGVSDVAIYKWETAQTIPTSDKLPALADVLGCTIDALYGRDGAKAG
jgi:transcriptional regulator with XRE-family HTH domain